MANSMYTSLCTGRFWAKWGVGIDGYLMAGCSEPLSDDINTVKASDRGGKITFTAQGCASDGSSSA
jgi:hypothetical protein